ncbi:MAG: hypothetical protein SW019_13925 [Actinomycetota bacterium]|nr:hypothetical protein [Actinomycetota bacterium]
MGQPSETQPTADDERPGPAAAGDAPPPPAADAPPAPGTDAPPPATPRPKPQWGRAAARQAAAVSAKLAPLARAAGDRVAAASPTTVLLGLLGLLVALSIAAALTFDSSLGVAATVLFVPVLSAAFGAISLRCLDDRRKAQVQREDAREDTRALHQAEHTLDYIDTKLNAALTRFGTERHNEAVIGMFQAKAATELYLGTDRQPAPKRTTEPESEDVDLVSRYGLAELLTPRSVGGQDRTSASSDRDCA